MSDEIVSGSQTAVSPVAHHLARSTGERLTIDPCELGPCTVDRVGATSCGALACPSCGIGGATLSIEEDIWADSRYATCRHCGYSWVLPSDTTPSARL